MFTNGVHDFTCGLAWLIRIWVISIALRDYFNLAIAFSALFTSRFERWQIEVLGAWAVAEQRRCCSRGKARAGAAAERWGRGGCAEGSETPFPHGLRVAGCRSGDACGSGRGLGGCVPSVAVSPAPGPAAGLQMLAQVQQHRPAAKRPRAKVVYSGWVKYHPQQEEVILVRHSVPLNC